MRPYIRISEIVAKSFARQTGSRRSGIALHVEAYPESDSNVPKGIPNYESFLAETVTPSGNRALRRAMWIIWPGKLPEGDEVPWPDERRLLLSTNEIIVLFLK